MSKFEQFLTEGWVNPIFKDVSKNWNITPEEATKLWGKFLKQAEKEGKKDKVSYVMQLFNAELKKSYSKDINKIDDVRKKVEHIQSLDVNIKNTHSHENDESARKNGVTLYPTFYKSGEKQKDRLIAVDSKTNKVIFNDNKEWVHSQIKKHGMRVTKDLSNE